jgi:hypothetical protein
MFPYEAERAKKGDVISLVNAPQRASIKRAGTWLVEDARMGGGGGAHNDVYPDGWQLSLRKLAPDGQYDPSGETQRVYQGAHWFTTNVGAVSVVGKMQVSWS